MSGIAIAGRVSVSWIGLPGIGSIPTPDEPIELDYSWEPDDYGDADFGL
jgi:hypothetical protein